MPQKQPQAKIGDTIVITQVQYKSAMFPDGIDHQALEMIGKSGTVERIDSIGTLWGTWGGLGVTSADEYTIL